MNDTHIHSKIIACRDTVKLLQRYAPADEEERHHVVATLELLRSTESWCDRNNFSPGHLTASIFIVDFRGRLLLLFHRKLGRWLQPGGHLEKQEYSAEAAAAREIFEECGIQFRSEELNLIDVDIHCIPENRTEPSHFHYDLRFLAFSNKPKIRLSSESIRYRWFDAMELRELSLDTGLARAIGKIERTYETR